MPEARSARITIRLTPAEKQRVIRQARHDGVFEAFWARRTLLAACHSSSEGEEPPCVCGCARDRHQGPEGLGGAQCLDCPDDGEGSWRHRYTPESRTS